MMTQRTKYQFSDAREAVRKSAARPRETASSLSRLVKRERWEEVGAFLAGNGNISREDRDALATAFYMKAQSRRGRPSRPTNDEQERMQWARYFFHEVRLAFNDEVKRKNLPTQSRWFLADEVVSEANCEFPGLPNKLKLSDFMGPKNQTKKNFPIDRPQPKSGYFLADDYATARVRVNRRLRKALRDFEAKR